MVSGYYKGDLELRHTRCDSYYRADLSEGVVVVIPTGRVFDPSSRPTMGRKQRRIVGLAKTSLRRIGSIQQSASSGIAIPQLTRILFKPLGGRCIKTPSLHLVDDNGDELSGSIVDALDIAAPALFSRCKSHDPAEVSEVLELSGKIATRVSKEQIEAAIRRPSFRRASGRSSG